MKHVLTVDIQQKDGKYIFIVQEESKRTTFEINSLGEGFKKVMGLMKREINGE